MARPVKFGVIGCGSIGKLHAEVISQLPDAELVAVCDTYGEAARKLAAQLGCEAYEDYAAMLARDDIEVVNVCTISGMHAEHGIAAAEAGKHVIVEKPIDVSLEKVDRLIELCDRKGLKLGCIFQHRFDPAIRRIKDAVAAGRFGELLFGNVSVKWFREQAYYDQADWRGTWALDGGVLANQGSHYLDELLWIMGDVAEVTFAQIATRAHRMEADDTALATVHFANGAWGLIQGSTATWPGLAARLEICGTKGSAVMAADEVAIFRAEGDEEQTAGPVDAPAASSSPAIASLKGHDTQIADFIAALREGRDPLITGREGRRSLALLTEIYRKATGRAMLGGG